MLWHVQRRNADSSLRKSFRCTKNLKNNKKNFATGGASLSPFCLNQNNPLFAGINLVKQYEQYDAITVRQCFQLDCIWYVGAMHSSFYYFSAHVWIKLLQRCHVVHIYSKFYWGNTRSMANALKHYYCSTVPNTVRLQHPRQCVCCSVYVVQASNRNFPQAACQIQCESVRSLI